MTGGAGFASFRMQAGQGINPVTWLQIGEGTAPVSAGLLGEWDTTRAPDGLYALRLLVVRADQSVEVAVATVCPSSSRTSRACVKASWRPRRSTSPCAR